MYLPTYPDGARCSGRSRRFDDGGMDLLIAHAAVKTAHVGGRVRLVC